MPRKSWNKFQGLDFKGFAGLSSFIIKEGLYSRADGTLQNFRSESIYSSSTTIPHFDDIYMWTKTNTIQFVGYTNGIFTDRMDGDLYTQMPIIEDISIQCDFTNGSNEITINTLEIDNQFIDKLFIPMNTLIRIRSITYNDPIRSIHFDGNYTDGDWFYYIGPGVVNSNAFMLDRNFTGTTGTYTVALSYVSATVRPSFIPYKEKLIITLEDMRPIVLSGSSSRFLGITPPYIVSASESSTSNMTAGDKQYVATIYSEETGESGISNIFDFTQVNNNTAIYVTVDCMEIPDGAKLRLYRIDIGTTTDFQFAVEMDLTKAGRAVIIDNVETMNLQPWLDKTFDVILPHPCRTGTVHDSRLFLGALIPETNVLMYSEDFLPDKFRLSPFNPMVMSVNATNSRAPAQEPKALVSTTQGLLIFLNSAIYILAGHTDADFRMQMVSNAVGCVSKNTIAIDDVGTIYFLAPNGAYRMSGLRLENISLLVEDFFTSQSPHVIRDSHAAFLLTSEGRFYILATTNMPDYQQQVVSF